MKTTMHKMGKRVLGFVLVLVMIVPFGLEAIISAAMGDTVDLVVRTEEVLAAMDAWIAAQEGTQPVELGTYFLVENAPETTIHYVDEDGNEIDEIVQVESDTIVEFELDQAIVAVVDDLQMPSGDGSTLMMKDLLRSLEGTVLVRFFDTDATGDRESQAIVVLDPEEYELYAYLINSGTAQKRFCLTVVDGDGNAMALSDVKTLIKETATRLLTAEELQRYIDDPDVEVEIVSVEVTEVIADGESVERVTEPSGNLDEDESLSEKSPSEDSDSDRDDTAGDDQAETNAEEGNENSETLDTSENMSDDSSGDTERAVTENTGDNVSKRDSDSDRGESGRDESDRSSPRESDESDHGSEMLESRVNVLPRSILMLEAGEDESGEFEMEDSTPDREDKSSVSAPAVTETAADESAESNDETEDGNMDDEEAAGEVCESDASNSNSEYKDILPGSASMRAVNVYTVNITVVDEDKSGSEVLDALTINASPMGITAVGGTISDGTVDAGAEGINEVIDPTIEGIKEATLMGAQRDGIYEIELKVSSSPKVIYESSTEVVPGNVIVVMDLSNSMNTAVGGQNRWAQAQEAVNAMADALLTDGTNNYMALTGYGSANSKTAGISHGILLGYTQSADEVKGVYNGRTISSMRTVAGGFAGATNCMAGFVGAKEMLAGAPSDSVNGQERQNFIVFVSDGAANYYYSEDNQDGTYKETGTGGSYHTDSGNAAVMYANTIGAQEATIFTVGIDLSNSSSDNSAAGMMRRAASSNGFYTSATTANLIERFSKLGVEIQHTKQTFVYHTELHIVDPMSEYVDFLGLDSVRLERSADTMNWDAVASGDYTVRYNESARTLYADVDPYDGSYVFRLVYEVQVKEQYTERREFKNDQYASAPVSGSDGMPLNGITTLETDLITPEQEIKVPTGWRKGIGSESGSSFEIEKVDDSGNHLSGVGFELRQGDAVAVTLTTDDNGIAAIGADELADGSYDLYESFASSQYIPLDSKLATLQVADGEITVTPGNGNGLQWGTPAAGSAVRLIVTNTKYPATVGDTVAVQKLVTNDSGDTTSFAITFTNSADAGDAVSVNVPANGGLVNVEGLQIGTTYTIEEAAQSGYRLEDITVRVNGEAPQSATSFTVPSDASKVTIEVRNAVDYVADGSVTLTKSVRGGQYVLNDSDRFSFFVWPAETTRPDSAVMTLAIGESVDLGKQAGLIAGNKYWIAEAAAAGYKLSGIQGATHVSNGVYEFTAGSNLALEAINEWDTIDPTDHRNKIDVVKYIDGAAGGNVSVAAESFGITVTNGAFSATGTINSRTGAFAWDDASLQLPVGVYTIVETLDANSSFRFEKFSIGGTDYTGIGSFTVAAGSGAMINVYNLTGSNSGDDTPDVTIEKRVNGTVVDAADRFEVTVAEKNGPVHGSYSLAAGEKIAVTGLKLGVTYTVSESDYNADYEFASLSTSEFTLTRNGADVTIVVTNDLTTIDRDSLDLEVVKYIDGVKGGNTEIAQETFAIRFTSRNDASFPAFGGTINSHTGVFAWDDDAPRSIPVGTYEVSEVLENSNYDFETIRVNGADGNTFTLSNERPGHVLVEVYNKTATNTGDSKGQVSVQKLFSGNYMPDGLASETFTIQLSGGGETHLVALGAGESKMVADLTYGVTYTVTEVDLPEGTALEAITVSGRTTDSGDAVRFTLHRGEKTIEIVATNRWDSVDVGDSSAIEIVKLIDGVAGGIDGIAPELFEVVLTNVDFSETISAGSIYSRDGAMYWSVDSLPAGRYTVEEILGDGSNYKLENITVYDAETGEELAQPFAVFAGSKRRIVIENTTTENSGNPGPDDATVTLSKQLASGLTGTQAFAIELVPEGSSLPSKTYSLPPGGSVDATGLKFGATYRVVEHDAHANYALESITINGTTYSAEEARFAKFTMEKGTDITITVTNTVLEASGDNLLTVTKIIDERATMAPGIAEETFVVAIRHTSMDYTLRGEISSKYGTVSWTLNDSPIAALPATLPTGSYTVEEMLADSSNFAFDRITVTVDRGLHPENFSGSGVFTIDASTQSIDIAVYNTTTHNDNNGGGDMSETVTAEQQLSTYKTFFDGPFEAVFAGTNGTVKTLPLTVSVGEVNVNGLIYGETYTVSQNTPAGYPLVSITVDGESVQSFTMTRGTDVAVVVTNLQYQGPGSGGGNGSSSDGGRGHGSSWSPTTGIDDTVVPLANLSDPMVPLANIPEEPIPLSGGTPVELAGAAGAGLLGFGAVLKRKKKKKDAVKELEELLGMGE